MSKHRKNKGRRGVIQFFGIALIAVVIGGCSTSRGSPRSVDPEAYFDWFVNPAQVNPATLSPSLFSQPSFDSALRELRKRSVTGLCTLRINDTAGIPYSLGFKTPSTIRQDSTYPLIVYLHGGSFKDVDNKGQFAWDMLTPLSDTFHLFLASPSANKYALWWSPLGISRILQTIRYMTLHYPIDPNKIFLAGVSDGATGSYEAANTICDPFAGIVSVSGFGGMLLQMGIELYPSNIMQRPIYDVHAGLDRLYPLEYVNRFLDELTSRGVAIKRKVYPDQSHGFDYRGQEMGTLAGLIRTWSKPDFKGLSWTFVNGYPNRASNIISWTPLADSKTAPQIGGSWHGDTLVLQEDGLKSITITAPGSITSESILVKEKNGKIIRGKLAHDPELPFMIAQHDLFPVPGRRSAYVIKF